MEKISCKWRSDPGEHMLALAHVEGTSLRPGDKLRELVPAGLSIAFSFSDRSPRWNLCPVLLVSQLCGTKRSMK
jgi:hypothetical protein